MLHPLPALRLALQIALAAAAPAHAADASKPATGRAALAVATVKPQASTLPTALAATGNIAAWQEAIVGTEAPGLRLSRILVAIGNPVKKGQLLAEFDGSTVKAELAQTRAAVAEAEAAAAEASANARRARGITETGALSAQQVQQYLTAERTALARLDALRAAEKLQRLRLKQTRVLAPDDGTISARNATLGAVMPPGQELFRIIRRNRLEWRAELAATDLARVQPGSAVTLSPGGGIEPLKGIVRMVAPTVDPASRNGLVYVDLPTPGAARPGMFARGEFDLGRSQALTLPQTAVLLRDGFSYVLRVGAESRVALTKVQVGRRVGDRVEITGGLAHDARVVASGGAFLADGDTVRVVEAKP